ncbi:Uncharacterized protein DBV15_03365 [Temnothorax longispinosus]|uniref:Uncharacterized protein n=1 Tax=Temnothorax longispinosus TaxID=300112 RepID=A0A4S2JQ70_9HYME|nr:Uncharacterized protein DBV15_03365 [Temnothorax longispinosus]
MLRHDAAVWGARRVMWRQADNPLAPSDKYEVRRTFSVARLHYELTERPGMMDIGGVEQPRSPVRPENSSSLMKRIMARHAAFKHFVAERQHSCYVSTEKEF